MQAAARRAFDVALGTHRRFGADSGGFLAAALTYNAFLSLFPLLLLGMSVLGFVLAGDPALQARATQSLSTSVPGIGPLVGENLDAVVRARSTAGIVGLVGLVWTGSGVADAASLALARVWRTALGRSTVRNKLRSLATVGTLGLIGLAGLAATITVTALDATGIAGVALRVGGVLAGLAFDFALFLAAYRLLGRHPGSVFASWRGALFAATGWSIVKLIGGWYASRSVASASAVYGTFASTIGILVILSLAARIFLYGAELNALFAERTGGEGAMPEGQRDTESVENGHRSTPALVRSIATDTATLVRKEVQLARQEIVEAIIARVKAAAAMAAAGVAALIGVIFLGAAAAHALEAVMEPWAARLVVGGGFLLLAGIVSMLGLMRAKQPPIAPEMTVQTVKEDIQWAKAQLKR